MECPRCGWPESDVYEVLSRHLTSEGVVTYTRCACGRLQMRVQRFEAGAVVAAGRRDAAAPDRP
ncbi:hypothetical protein SAMN05443665_1004170 [Actinomadura meyerae]|uniref:Ogr/Delta-like zinc finger n=1 Tax=Actinomadura meyerae TaxID=240840 RepID=A0A239EPI6_9ACTN|nr:hypothetical protein SAMN05443665_1004170 [Actinomadura meyerae]